MSIEIVDTSNNVLTFRVTGLLKQPELAAVQKEAGAVIQKLGKVRLLVLTEKFEGWERGGNWGDLSFSSKYDPVIEKMAVVGEQKWEDLALMFTSKGIRRVEIEYFLPSEEAQARAWLAAGGQDPK
jgi:hypothetical protein